MPKVVSLRMKDSDYERLRRVTRRVGRTISVTAGLLLEEAHGGSPEAVAMHLEWPLPRVRAALAYADAFPGEMRVALEDNQRFDFDQVSRMLPEAARMAEDEC